MKAIYSILFFLGYFNVFSQDLENFDLNWKGDTNHFEFLNSSIILNAYEAGISEVFIKTPNYFTYTYEFVLNLDFSPSSSNLFRHFLFKEIGESFYLELGESGSLDRFHLVYENHGIKNTVYSTNQIFPNGFDSLLIQIDKNYEGYRIKIGDEEISSNQIFQSDSVHIGFESIYTSSNVNGTKVCEFAGRETSKDTIPPSLLFISWPSKNVLTLHFDEPVFDISDSLFKPQLSTQIVCNHLVTINTEIFDRNENILIVDTTFQSPFVDFQDLAFNEFMIDPSPSLGYYEEEYIELINLSGKRLRALDLTIVYNGDTSSIEIDDLKPDSLFLIDSFSLSNDEFSIELFDSYGTLIDAFFFDYDMFSEKDYSGGGWSLEKIDPEFFGDFYESWVYHESFLGGSPGKQNQTETLLDNDAPYVVMVTADNFGHNYHFNEPVLQGNKVTFESDSLSNVFDLSGNMLNDTILILKPTKELSPGDLRISEIMYKSGEVASFIEIQNLSEDVFILEGLRLVEVNDNESIPIYTFPNKLVQAKEVFTITSNKYSLQDYKYCKKRTMINDASLPIFKTSEMHLALMTDDGIVIDEVYYTSKWFDHLNLPEPYSIERLKWNGVNEESWQATGSLYDYMTPGFVLEHDEHNRNKFALSNNSIGSTFDLQVIESSASSVSIYLYSIEGTFIEEICKDVWLGSSDQIFLERKNFDYTGLAIMNIVSENENESYQRQNLVCWLTSI